jgi:hypothetical protein
LGRVRTSTKKLSIKENPTLQRVRIFSRVAAPAPSGLREGGYLKT